MRPGHWGACEDKLDETGRLDSIGNQTLEVNEARNRIGRNENEDVGGVDTAYAKPGVGPGEVPLRRTPHR